MSEATPADQIRRTGNTTMSGRKDKYDIEIDDLLGDCYRLLDFKARSCRSAMNAGVSVTLKDLAVADYNSYASGLIDMVTSVTKDDTVDAVRTMAGAKALEYDLRSERNPDTRDS